MGIISGFKSHRMVAPFIKTKTTDTHSIILMAIAGPNYECLYSVVESSGRVNDSCIWNKNFLLPIFFFSGMILSL